MITYGTNPGMGIADHAAGCPTRRRSRTPIRARALDKALRYMGLQPGSRCSGHQIDVVFIGSCTNSRISRPARGGEPVSKGRKVAAGRARCWWCPARRT